MYIVFGEVLKQSRPNFHQSGLSFEAFKENPSLCIVTQLQEYLKCTAEIRGEHTKLFLSYQKPHLPICKSTISRWIKTVLEKAGIDMNMFTPHSTRAASMSAAYRANVPIATIMKTAGWSNVSTFSKFYQKALLE